MLLASTVDELCQYTLQQKHRITPTLQNVGLNKPLIQSQIVESFLKGVVSKCLELMGKQRADSFKQETFQVTATQV